MKKSFLGLAIASAFVFASQVAQAEDMYRGAWYVVPGATYMNTDNDLEADNGRGGFLSIGKELSEHWDIQGRLGYNRADEDLGIAGASGKYKQTALGLDALYLFSRDKFRPFLLAGLGAARNNVDYSVPGLDVDGKKTSWMANVGLGAQYLFNDKFGIQADLRHQWSRARVAATNGVVSDSETDTIGNTLFNIGGIFRFGAPAPVVEEPTPEPTPAPMAAAEPAPAPAPAPAPIPAPMCKPQNETVTVSAEKLFGFDKANLREEGRKVLEETAAKIKSNPEISAVVVTGHTDRIGSDAYNQKLSERRAKQVADYLIAQGVDSNIITSEGKGKTEPVVQCDGKKVSKKLISCLQPNRRVEIRAEGTKQVGCQ
ncbi:OmpA family protein [Methylophilus medardicus]|uniref:Flagellar motor protein MotB n=1 Tax=Methylophilus medardicus TaxID=2588534 RepID=A0A5B8CRW6_9PROT|nr:OmpA family protein [Methylophilus medardicus]QDC44048.1 flagellar motor protein MotB [Methylophilus medardicus]QDC49055.1 flagellar motor protein MotB [Methylophilus medardicus]QDC52760.1 flagellar motor protein MotB [Methylophilus medardicus]